MVLVDAGARQRVTVSTNANLLPYISTVLRDGVLVVQAVSGVELRPTGSQAVRIVTEPLHDVAASGAEQRQRVNDRWAAC